MSETMFVIPAQVLAQHRVGPIDPAKIASAIGESPALYASIVAGILCVAFVIWFVKRHYDAKLEPGYANDDELFTELCQAHALNAKQIALLRELAAHQELPDPNRLFIEQGHFTENLGPELNARIDELSRLREQLFSLGA